jgi:uroporphyrinogen III methyltransferase / synthase
MPDSPDPVQSLLAVSKQPASDAQARLSRVTLPGAAEQVGKVYLVGAGPGDPRLLTLRGYQCLQRADCVLYDGLANLALLDFAPKAEKICVGKHGKTPIWKQETINSELLRLAGQGKIVVRLKGGDPAVFARTAEELEALERSGVDYEVVPGITAALAVAGYTGIPLTHRDHSSAVALVTGMQQNGSPIGMDWKSLAQFPGTLSVYMGVTTSEYWTEQLIAAGKSPGTPAAIVRRCTWSDQKVVYCRLDEVAGHLTPASKMRPPVLVVVGPVAHLGKQWNWFFRQPLFGIGVWLPRPAQQNGELAERLTELGASVVCHPVMEIRPPEDLTELRRAVDLLRQRQLQGIAFSSSNAVDGLLKFLKEERSDLRLLGPVRLAVVGPGTARHLEKYLLLPDVTPEADYSAAGLVSALGSSVKGEQWLVCTTNRSKDTLQVGITRAGGRVTTCLTYETLPVEGMSEHLSDSLEHGRVNYAMITSPHVAELAHRMLGSHIGQVRPIALNDAVAGKLSQLGWPSIATSQSNTVESLLASLLDAVHSEPSRQECDHMSLPES